MIIQKIHLASRFFIRTVCGFPAMQSCSLHPPDAIQGFGGSQQVFCRAKFAFVYTNALLAGTMKLLDVLPSLKIILQARPSASKFNLKRTVIFLFRKFLHLQPPQAGQAGTISQFLNLIFYKSDFKNTCWASPKPDIQHKNALVPHLNGR